MARVSSIDPSGHFDHLYAHLHHLIVEYFVVESHHGSFLYFPTSLVNSKNSKKQLSHIHRVVRENLNYGLRVCRIFSCEKKKKDKRRWE